MKNKKNIYGPELCQNFHDHNENTPIDVKNGLSIDDFIKNLPKED